MCLITTQLTAKTVKEEMTVFKLLKRIDSRHAAAYMCSDFQYELGKTYKTKIEQSNDWTYFDVQDGDYLNNNIPDWRGGRMNKDVKCFGQGFHAATDIERIRRHHSRKPRIYKCTIPKGAKYYTNGDNLIISNSICIDKLYSRTPLPKF